MSLQMCTAADLLILHFRAHCLKTVVYSFMHEAMQARLVHAPSESMACIIAI